MWSEGCISIPMKDGSKKNFHFEVKHFQRKSEYGIDGGKISKLYLAENVDGRRITAANYDRGWDIKPEAGSPEEIACWILLNDYN